MLLADGNGHIIDFQDHKRRKWQDLPALAVLDLDGEWGESRILGTEANQFVEASASKVIFLPIKSGIVMIPHYCACGKADSMAILDAIDYATYFASLAAGWLTHYNAYLGVTPAERGAVLIPPEFLLRFVVEAIVGTATTPHRDTSIDTEHVAFIALAGFHTGHLTRCGSPSLRAGVWAATSTGLVVAVLRTGQSWKEGAE